MNYQEYKQLLNRELAKKVQREFDEFRKDILTKNPQEIYDSACQIVLKSDIAECFSKPNYSPQAAKALYEIPELLQDIMRNGLKEIVFIGRIYAGLLLILNAYMVKTERILSGKWRDSSYGYMR